MRRFALVLTIVTVMGLSAGVASAEHGNRGGYSPAYHHGGHRAVPHQIHRYQYGHAPYGDRHCVPHSPYAHYNYRPYVPPRVCAPQRPYVPAYPSYQFGYHGKGFSIHLGY